MPKKGRTHPPKSTLRLDTLLSQDHAHLEALYRQLVAAFEADLAAEAARLWGEFETATFKHFELEEKQILPAFASTHPREAAELLQEHAEFRQKLAELGVDVDLHVARSNEVAELVDKLRAHGEREGALLYRWAQEQLAEETRTKMSEHLRGRTR